MPSDLHLSSWRAVALRLHPGDDLKLALAACIERSEISAAAIISGVGSLQRACMRLADESLPAPYPGPFEMVSVTGTLGRQGCHMHLSIADASGSVIGGHMLAGCIVHTTAEIVLADLTDLQFGRVYDVATGFKELEIRPRSLAADAPLQRKP